MNEWFQIILEENNSLKLPSHLPSLCNTFMNLLSEFHEVMMGQNLNKCIYAKGSALK